LKFSFAPLGSLLLKELFVLHIGDILNSTLPVGVQDQSLVVFGLG
jgi:hypothetical protein